VACHISVRTETKNGSRRELYRKSLGAEETLFTYWHVPAFEIELPLLAQIYHDGLEVRDELLDVLLLELERLGEHWQSNGIGDLQQIPCAVRQPDGVLTQGHVSLNEHLLAKLALAREAIRIAKQSGGVVEIS